MCGNQAHLSWAPSTFYPKGPEPPQQVQGPSWNKGGSSGKQIRLCVCVCVRSVCMFLFLLWSIRFFSKPVVFFVFLFFFFIFLICKNKMQMNKRLKLPKLSETVADFDMKRIKFLSLCVCVCVLLIKGMNPWLSCYLRGCLRPRFVPRVVSASSIACFVRWVCVSRPTRWSTIKWKYQGFQTRVNFSLQRGSLQFSVAKGFIWQIVQIWSQFSCWSCLRRRIKVEWTLLSSPIRHIPTNPDQ